MSKELPSTYEPKNVENAMTQLWESGGYFHAEPDGEKTDSYTIVIPPPNVTAPLHLGHALNNTLQDILIRFHRMRQFNTLWMPGTDHAGIATQTVVEKRLLAEQGKRRTDFQREEFIDHVRAWKDEYEARILAQLKAMGCSCDWQRTRFTMDDVCAKAVRATFFRLFADGLIYRGKRLVNWDPATQTVLADDEVEHETVQGHFWYMQYPLEKPVTIAGQKIEHITVATTRPETMLGDTAVAMNPADPRAKDLIGKKVLLPIVGRKIPIIGDDHVVLPDTESDDEKAKYSTGFLKVTPAHDPDDWEIGQRHNLPIINVMAPDGTISDKFGFTDANQAEAEAFLGMDRFEAREAIIEWFRQEKLLEKVREYVHDIGHSYRSHVPIEPYLSDQWYIAVKKPIDHLGEKVGSGMIEGTDVPVNSLAGLALKPLLDEKLRFIPHRYAKTYQNWLENLRDWPISRQLWWGHRIPVWSKAGTADSFKDKFGNLAAFKTVQKDDGKTVTYACIIPNNENIEKKLEDDGWKQDDDVLDTWFSSALWPFSTLGWPDDTPELKEFYPGDVLCTAREIITLWVSRMVIMGQYCVGDIPFSDVYIHAMIQDGQGRKMSKSLGNGIDPLVAIDSHGADAMRFTLASMTTETQDVRMPVEQMTLPGGRVANTSPKFDIGRNFCNKLWNACRFAMMNLHDIEPDQFDAKNMDITDKWILSRLAETIDFVTQSMRDYKFSEPLGYLYKFFWNDLCDWYLEWAKPRMEEAQSRATAQCVLSFVLDRTLLLLHPFVPFITEFIFQNLNEIAPRRSLSGIAEAPFAKSITVAKWPDSLCELRNKDIEQQIEAIQTAIRTIRDIRSKYNIPPKKKMTASANAPTEQAKILTSNNELICRMAGLEQFTAGPELEKPKNAAASIVEQMQLYLHDAIDPAAEMQRLTKQLAEIEAAMKPVQAKLNNEKFITRAKKEVVERTRQKYAELSEQLEAIKKHVTELQS